MVSATRDCHIKTSQAKLDKITTNYMEMVTFVTNITFPEASMIAFTSNVVFQQASALKTHTNFVNELNKININYNTNEEDITTQPTPGPSKYTKRLDLAKKCNSLTKDDNYDVTSNF